jgi:hypothetical protein
VAAQLAASQEDLSSIKLVKKEKRNRKEERDIGTRIRKQKINTTERKQQRK